MRYRGELIILVVVTCMMSVAWSVAYFTAQIETDNVITFGNVDIQLHETCIDEKGTEVAVDTSDTETIEKASSVERHIKIENTGVNPAFVRFTINTWMDGTKANKRLMNFENELGDWIYDDGWFYYPHILNPGMTSEPFITKVIFDVDKITAEKPDCEMSFDIVAQAVQSENNQDDVLEVKGWPKGGAVDEY